MEVKISKISTSKQNKTKCPHKAKWSLRKRHLVHFVLPNSVRVEWWIHPGTHHWRIFLCCRVSVGGSFLVVVGRGPVPTTPFSVLGPYLAWTCTSLLPVAVVSEFVNGIVKTQFPWSCLCPLALIISPCSLSQSSLTPEPGGEGFAGDLPFRI